jgi:hypothetical protein
MFLVKNSDNNTYIKTKGFTSSKKIDKPNRNIKPFIRVNDEIKILWEIESNIDINKKVFGGYIRACTIT